MSAPCYLTSCPTCGMQLTPHVGTPDQAPWLCDFATGGCGYAFWPSQLTAEGRQSWRPLYWDHAGGDDGHSFIAEMHTRCLEDRAAAVDRGTSALPEQVPTLDESQLQSLQTLLTPRAPILDGAFVLLTDVTQTLDAMTAIADGTV